MLIPFLYTISLRPTSLPPFDLNPEKYFNKLQVVLAWRYTSNTYDNCASEINSQSNGAQEV